MNTAEVRKLFLDYYQSKGHQIVPSAALVPDNDPTILFSNAGMNQFKDLFLGTEKRDYSRATTSQKCLRISGKHNDLENVGPSASHHTFFEMLGNFSFGDYFKREAIEFAWELCLEIFKLDQNRLWVTIFEDDDEAEELWKKHTNVDPKRIIRLGEKENFWSMGDTGPCGPCSELHYYRGEDLSTQSAEDFLLDDGRYVEIYNLVFMQFDRDASGKMNPLPNPSIDTGMGLERISSILADVPSNYGVMGLKEIVDQTQKLSSKKYDGTRFGDIDLKSDKQYAIDVAMRVIADHSRSIAFLLADGVQPASDGRGYVLRRLIRRAVRYGRGLGLLDPFLFKTTATVVKTYADIYPELSEHKELISRVTEAEEIKFHETLESGLRVLDQEVKKLGSGQKLPGSVAFMLHDTYGFPVDLTQDALKAEKVEVDVDAFQSEMNKQRQRSKQDRESRGISFESLQIDCEKTSFLGYESLESKSKLLFAQEADEQGYYSLVFDQTPFYAESGGQVGDQGQIRIGAISFEVLDTQKSPSGHFVHAVRCKEGQFSTDFIGSEAELQVNQQRRQQIRVNHSATHLMHAALREVLGDHVKQAGSRVDDQSLRFDYSHFEAVTDEQLKDIGDYVNAEIRANYPVTTDLMDLEAAKARGAMALFGEKYSAQVRVVEIGPNSLELCGGTHVERSGDIGIFLIQSEGSISSGVRRISCVSAEGALRSVMQQQEDLKALSRMLKTDQGQIASKVQALLDKQRDLERELEASATRAANSKSHELLDQKRVSPNGIAVIASEVNGADSKTLRSLVDSLRVQLGSGVVALAGREGEKAILVAGATSDLKEKVNVGALVSQAAKSSGGRGGGRKDFAQAGGLATEHLQQALEQLFESIQ